MTPYSELRYCSLLAIFIALSACSSIDRASDLKNHRLSAQVSSKTDIINAIGLPRRIERQESDGTEIWFYTGKPINTSYFIPLPVAAVPAGAGMSMVYYVDIGSKADNLNEPIALVLIFEKNGSLLKIDNRNILK